jgi:hypothetical protein
MAVGDTIAGATRSRTAPRIQQPPAGRAPFGGTALDPSVQGAGASGSQPLPRRSTAVIATIAVLSWQFAFELHFNQMAMFVNAELSRRPIGLQP